MSESAGSAAKRATAAGFLIGIGCAANASVGGIAGAILFSTALVLIVTTGLPLFTGKIGFVTSSRDLENAIRSLPWNLAGAGLAALLFAVTQLGDATAFVSAQTSGAAKCATPLGAFFAKAVFCGVLVHMAVKAYRTSARLAPAILCVVAFVLCGYEHCVADAFVLAFVETDVLTAVVRLATAIAGNAIGALFIEIHTRTER